MKKTLSILTSIGFLAIMLVGPSAAQSQGASQETEIQALQVRGPTYDPAGRRDPFRDLLAGQEAEKGKGGGLRQVSVDDAVLVGIVKHKGRLTAIINDAQGFPYTIRKGDTFLDGFVLSIDESRVVFRKTKERGIPLYKPKDIIKEIKLEERMI